MPKKEATPTINLWGQWLQRINVGTDPEAINDHRIDLLRYVLDNQISNDQFYCRFGTILLHSIFAELIVIHRVGNTSDTILFTNALKREYQYLSPLMRTTLKNDFQYQNQKINLRIQINRHNQPIRYQYEWLLSQEEKIVLLIGSRVALEPLDLEFLHTLKCLVEQRLKLQNRETALSLEKDRFKSLTHQLGEGLIVTNAKLTVSLWNKPVAIITGYRANDVVNRPVEQFVNRKNNPFWLKEIIDGSFEPPTDFFTTDFEIQPKNGQTKWISVSGSILRNQDRSIDQVLLLVRDISKNKELEKQKNDFISIATHELRTPITAIKGYLAFLMKDSSDFSEKQLRHLNRATQATERLVNLSEELLEVIRIQQNRHQFSLKPTPLLPVIDKVISDFMARAKEKNLQLSLHATQLNPSVLADPTRLEQVIANLVDNAIKYTQKGSVELSLSVIDQNSKPLLVLSIRDTGIGMSNSEIENIFNKFHRTESAEKTGETGAGIGLFIVRTFIEKMFGKIEIASKPNKGTTCNLKLVLVTGKETF